MRRMLNCTVLLAGILAGSQARATKLIAVLPLDVRNTDGKVGAAAQASLEEMLRDVATDNLAPAGWVVLTGENMIQVLEDNGVDLGKCTDSQCHLNMARKIKAEKFISGAVQYVEGTFTASVRLIDTASGSIKASERVEGKTVTALRKDFESKARAFFAKAGLLSEAEAAPVAAPAVVDVTAPPDVPASSGPHVKKGKVSAAVGTLTITAKPKDLVRVDLVDPDGKKTASGASYENRAAKPGTWKVVVRAAGYEEDSRDVEVAADDVTLEKFELKLLGSLKITGTPEGADVKVAGPGGFRDEGGLPWEADGLKSGVYQVSVTRKGYGEDSETVEVKPGDTARVRVKLEKGGGEWLSIPGGTFSMGSEDGSSDEKPVTRVTLSAYQMGRTEVTVAQFRACVNAGRCSSEGLATVNWSGLSDVDRAKYSKACNWSRSGFDVHPINCVDWTQAKAYCEWAGGRLPTEAEWEFAARGSDGRKYPWGSQEPNARLANACGSECVAWVKAAGWGDFKPVYEADDGWPTTAPVGSFPAGASPFGLQDMAGNVWEWVADMYAPYPGGNVTNPLQESGQSRVLRGGGWNNFGATLLRGAYRSRYDAGNRDDDLGFRCARGAVH